MRTIRKKLPTPLDAGYSANSVVADPTLKGVCWQGWPTFFDTKRRKFPPNLPKMTILAVVAIFFVTKSAEKHSKNPHLGAQRRRNFYRGGPWILVPAGGFSGVL